MRKVLSKVHVEVLYRNNIDIVARCHTDVAHPDSISAPLTDSRLGVGGSRANLQGDQHVLFSIKWTRVQRHLVTKDSKLSTRQNLGHELSERVYTSAHEPTIRPR